MDTMKFLIMILVSSACGSFVCDTLENTLPNVWIARLIGGIVAAIVGLICYKFLVKDEKVKS
ncbi:hypothetical protein [Staphylococcus lutrae]|uniref:Uncharacterized protein n=1 Tax=Staphylococcus lutrae TaxID=155085 RepID=A0AAC9WIW5_9STAP|nr:hypothetical protein [Staphylococcus lutrae]ARJ50684.1 hypothetical protein B5P37_04795 [Staphylococcus lutrae]PNZ34732.1 hypothetical protein CD134_10125 [Staphylococcus lutrae]